MAPKELEVQSELLWVERCVEIGHNPDGHQQARQNEQSGRKACRNYLANFMVIIIIIIIIIVVCKSLAYYNESRYSTLPEFNAELLTNETLPPPTMFNKR